jgi:hypothetical protein
MSRLTSSIRVSLQAPATSASPAAAAAAAADSATAAADSFSSNAATLTKNKKDTDFAAAVHDFIIIGGRVLPAAS